MNILFLCTANLNRSKTAEIHFSSKDPGNVYRSAGLSAKECRRNGTTLCTDAMLEWADLVYVMEQSHVHRIEQCTGKRFLGKIFNIDIPDIYRFGETALIEQLEVRYNHMRNR